jgi:lipopolysaccharide transport system ATP-binding protein
MSDIAIKGVGVGKRYQIGGQQTYDRLSDQLFDIVGAPFRRVGNLMKGKAGGAAELEKTIWALKDIDFEIKRGEVVGIIGRNGAGKSTLLKILSKITEPTEGYADIYGRVGSLLEVGTGFHPELTGRENVYLNGAILGMVRSEIQRKFDEIVAFAEIDEFIDTPVKHYSSGMYVRLAFSVAAHLEPEILLVDEVLAVGDVAFQRKCLGRMDEVRSEGRTVLFVSHNMAIMQNLCQKGLLIQQGKLVAEGLISDVIDIYLQSLDVQSTKEISKRTDRRGKGNARLIGVEVIGNNEGSISVLKTGQPAQFEFYVDRLLPDLHCNFSFYDHFGHPVAEFKSRSHGPEDKTNGEKKFVCEIDELLLLPGRYRMDVFLSGDKWFQDALEAATYIDVGEGIIRGRPVQAGPKFRVTIPHRWIVPKQNS